MLTFQFLLSLLQLSGNILVRDKPERVYCRELFCVPGNNSRHEALPSSYYVCPPASNFDCKKVDFKERQVLYIPCPEGKMWTGVGNGVVVPPYGFEKGDRFALRSSPHVPPSWRADICSVSGKFGLDTCKEEGEIRVLMVQVVLVNGKWYGVKSVQIEESPQPAASVCWSSTGWVKDCKEEEGLNCFCVRETVEELVVVRGSEKYKVDAVGVREILTRLPKEKFEISECSLKKVGSDWVVASAIDLEGRVVTVRKGEEMIKCNVENHRLCTKESWSMQSGEIIATFFMNGQIISSCSAYEAVVDLCGELGVMSRWKRYTCWGYIEHMLLAILCLISMWLSVQCFLFAWCFSSTTKTVCSCCWRASKQTTRGLITGGRIFGKLVKRGVRKLERKVIEIGAESEFDIEGNEGRRGIRSKLAKGLILGLATSSQFRSARADCSNLELSAFRTECGSETCMLSQSMRVVFPSLVTTMCVKPREEQLSELEFKFKTKDFRMECASFDEYWTADFDADSCSKFECGWSCPSQEKAWTKLRECGALEGDYTIKTSAPGCAANGCFECNSACMLIYPFYRVRKDESPVKVFRCKEWFPVVTIEVIKKTNGEVETYSEDLVFNSVTTVGPFKIRWLQMSYSPNYAYTEHFLISGDRACMLSAAVKGNIDPKKVGYVQCSSRQAAAQVSRTGCIYDTRDISCNTGSKNEVHCSMLKPSWKEICKPSWLPLNTGSSVLHYARDKIMLNIDSFGSMEFGLELEQPMVVDVVRPKASCVIAEAEVTGCYNCAEGAKLSMISEAKGGKPSVYVKCDSGIHPFTFTCGEPEVKVSAFMSEVSTECLAMVGFAKTSFKVRGSLRQHIDLPSLSGSGGSGQVIGPRIELPSWKELKWKILGPLIGIGSLVAILVLLFKFGVLTHIFTCCCERRKKD